jgi:hypothetical protein
MPETITPDRYPAILNFLNNPAAPGESPPYGDGMEAIRAAKFDDNGDIIAIGQDGGKVLAIKITDTGVAIKLANYGEVKEPEAKFEKYPEGQETVIASLKNVGDAQFGKWLDQIKDVIFTADDLGAAQEAIFEMFPHLESAEFAQEVNQHLTLAGLQGYFEADFD